MIISRTGSKAVVANNAAAAPPQPTIPTRRNWEGELAHGAHRLDPALRMSIQRPAPGLAVIGMDGEIDLSTAPRITELIRQRLTAAVLHALVIDLSEVSFIDTTGAELLIRAQRRAEQRGIELHVVPGAGCVKRILDLTGIDAGLNCHDSVEAALAQHRRP
ncbi:STAS domain-containing protein [Actinopolyspora sp. BKK1]|uniref:STAS domain-containing protein n=1 Tax=unclassified Actinopolyspora TaxID=2639451 RepID=UPI00325A6DC6